MMLRLVSSNTRRSEQEALRTFVREQKEVERLERERATRAQFLDELYGLVQEVAGGSGDQLKAKRLLMRIGRQVAEAAG